MVCDCGFDCGFVVVDLICLRSRICCGLGSALVLLFLSYGSGFMVGFAV